MKAMVYYSPKNVKIENVSEPQVQPGKVKVKVKYTGICGTDLHVYRGNKRIGAKSPMILGHEFAGEIVEIGESVSSCQVGDRVVIENFWGCGECIYCREGEYYACQHLEAYGLQHPGGFAEYVVVNENKVFQLPDNISFETAAVIEPTSVAMQSVKNSSLKIGDTVAVFGSGPMGSLVTQCAKAAGASKIIVVGHHENRRQIAMEMGADVVIDPKKEDPVKKIKELTGDGVDVAFDAAGVEETFLAALDSVKPKGELMIVSVFADPVTYNPFYQQKGVKTIKTTRGNHHMFPKVMDLLSKGSIVIDPVVTNKISLDDIVELGYNRLLAGEEGKVIVSPER
ncbi:2,3-butanediol dehydrogenase [Bacillus sp. B15-48]|uniref:2,3-butanediol dehydrogenase n=1 Tax=Bacillus sp. B15-48 TaxID=1548601 RepID=UPI00193F5871|nr:2,3-butanediol dehydrogenase [Bacillus sp. B15-48]MBM4763366.1 alcohol dehydrogenase catalytic domain-containing protein [Bacillus sp. B15-48]